MGACADALMLVLLDSNIYFSALISPLGSPARIVHAWRNGRFHLLTCQQQIDEIRAASRNLKFRALFQPHHVGDMLNHLYSATVCRIRCRGSTRLPIRRTATCST